ncbi:DEAD/DEAH box helicase [Marinomonas sp. PE14-40]|uniref:DEAD/DEAH box helicase n=1 Tax=Marinomonas sp. PE14-40 TaxID=3060621 RepID=UPI003F66AC20
MGILSFFKKVKESAADQPTYKATADSLGLNFSVDPGVLLTSLDGDTDALLLRYQHILLKNLEEQGAATRIANGFEVKSVNVVKLDESFYEAFYLPAVFKGSINTKIKGRTSQAAFAINAVPVMPNGELISHYELKGPYLRISQTEQFLLKSADWQALSSIDNHQVLNASQKTEFANNSLVLQLKNAEAAGCNIDLSHFKNIDYIQPEKMGLSMQELENGDLMLSPTFGKDLDQKDIENRLGQIGDAKQEMIFKVRNSFVLLDEKRLEAAKEILTTRRIPKSQVKKFFEAPTAYLNAAVIDLDTGFSMRVKGAEKFQHAYFGDVEESGVDWFGDGKPREKSETVDTLGQIINNDETLTEFKQKVEDAQELGAQTVAFEGITVDVTDKQLIDQIVEQGEALIANKHSSAHYTELEDEQGLNAEEPEVQLQTAVVAIDTNDDDVDFEVTNNNINDIHFEKMTFARDNLKREPFPHQEEGIQWLLGLMTSGQFGEGTPVGGGLLADDMGLGKSYMALVAIHEYKHRIKERKKREKPVLLVAPLSLLENWKDEIDKTFHASPFTDVVILQSAADLKRFKVQGAKKETLQAVDNDSMLQQDDIRYSLKVGGEYGADRLDQPNRLVLATYQTIRDYQFSLSRIDWAVVAFDEAQNIKNPNSIVTRAAKALKGDFKLLATGTPVENSLKDFWCLFDTAVPGLLGSWREFREIYIAPILDAKDDSAAVQQEVGLQLRQTVGRYMLRRTKEEKLTGLPAKHLWIGDEALAEGGGRFHKGLVGCMQSHQKTAYDQVLQNVHDQEGDKRALILSSLPKLRQICIHHDIDSIQPASATSKIIADSINASCKIQSLITILDEVKQKAEKVIIFATTKDIQRYLSFILGVRYNLAIDIVNGETKAISNTANVSTRKSILAEFEAREGFNAVIMSPIAAGVGLTVIGANNVIHLERHWNPAKEAQATDRVYRIGQKKEVNVYLPIATHPSIRTFDQQLAKLLQKKTNLSEAVIAQPDLQKDIAKIMEGTS